MPDMPAVVNPEVIQRYRKRPVVIEAIVFWPNNIVDVLKFVGDAIDDALYDANDAIVELRIKTLEGDHIARIGDYIIRGVKGEFYPCKPDIFHLTYEHAGFRPAEEGENHDAAS